MKKLCVQLLVLTLGSQSMLAAGPLERSLAVEARRLASGPVEDTLSDWRAVRRLERDSRIVVTTASGPVAGTFLEIDDRAIYLEHDRDSKASTSTKC